MSLLQAILTFFLSTGYILFLNHISYSSRSLQRALVIIVVVFFLILYRASLHSWKNVTSGFGRLFLLFWSTISVELLVISTGGIQSPFLILIHFLMIGISFIFNFFLSLLFLISAVIVLFFSVASPNNVTVVIPQIVSLIVIIPIAYIISRQYHLKDTVMNALTNKLKTTDAIIKTLPELIIVTDQNGRILSANDAATQTLQRSHAELLDKPLFDVLLLKDEDQKLVTISTFFPEGIEKQPQIKKEAFTLIQSPFVKKNVSLKIQTMETTKKSMQISFIISFNTTTQNNAVVSIDKARAKYEALSENIKYRLSGEHLTDIKTEMLLLEKIENDTYTLQSLNGILRNKPGTYIDLAKLCRQIVTFNKGFSDGLGVHTQFLLKNFGAEDIAPLTVANYPVNPEQLTGPFFTIFSDPKQVEIMIKKLFDMSILLSSHQEHPEVTLSIKRIGTDNIAVIIESTSSLPQDQTSSLFTAYYEGLTQKTNLQIGSGLEGFLAKTIADNLGTKIDPHYNNKLLTFSLLLEKKHALADPAHARD